MTRILVADDEPMVRETLVKILETSGYDVVVARTGKEACQLAEAQRPDVLLLDVDMPVMSGFEALQILRASPETRDLPIIMLTSTPAVVGEQAAMMYGVAHYISKPWKADVVEAAVRIVLRDTGSGTSIPGVKPEEPRGEPNEGPSEEAIEGAVGDETEDDPPPKINVRKVGNYREAPKPKHKPKPKRLADDPLFPGSLADSQG